jgi:hypothetical protein
VPPPVTVLLRKLPLPPQAANVNVKSAPVMRGKEGDRSGVGNFDIGKLVSTTI